MKKIPTIPSKTDAEINAANEVKEEDNSSLNIKEDLPVTIEKLKETWLQFFEKRKDNGKALLQTFANKKIRLEDESKVVITLINKIEEGILEDFKVDLMEHLKHQNQNRKIVLEAEINEEEAKERRPYTSSEKFTFLLEKHPLLREMADKFGLDPEY